MAVTGPAHDYLRPGWTCGGCPPGTPWPCPPAKVELGEQYAGDPLGLSWHMAKIANLAATEIPSLGQREFRDRFLAWAEPR